MKPSQKVYAKAAKLRFRESPDASGAGNIIRELPVGQEMAIVDGPWVKVKIGRTEGWVHADYISTEAPERPASLFTVGVPNLAGDDRTTHVVRAAIGDMYGGAANGWELQCTEYVTWRVKEVLGFLIDWPVTRGRNGGKWASIFKQYGTYPVSAQPARYAAMSFTAGISTDPKTNEIGHVAFVEEVFSDGSIRISEANWPRNGIYSERTLSKLEWQGKYKAMFTLFG